MAFDVERRNTPVVTDAECIERSLVHGDAFVEVFDRHYRRIHLFVAARVGTAAADDVASETFLIAFRRRAAYDLGRADAGPWLFGIAVNLLRDHRRAEARRMRAYARAAGREWIVGDQPEHGLDPAVAAALLSLGAADRHLILLFAWAELSYEQIAEALGIPFGTVCSRLNRARAKLRASLVDQDAPLAVQGGDRS